jgi:hypothetical protein
MLQHDFRTQLSGYACNASCAETSGVTRRCITARTQAARTGGFDAPADFLTFFWWKSGSGIRRP